MSDLQKYVDALFIHQRQTAEVKDLKEEVLSNMVAKRDDLIVQGIDKEAATQMAKENLSSVEGLVSGSLLAYADHYYAECLQNSLLGSILLWICTFPLLFTRYGFLSFCTLCVAIVFGALYVVRNKRKTDKVSFLSLTASQQLKKRVWIIWGIFFLVYVAAVAAVTFGSNIWFGQPVQISGPYQSANLAVRFYVPLLTIAIPITVSSFPKVLIKNEKRVEHE